MQATTDYAAKYTAAARDAYIKYADARDEMNAAYLLERANHYEVLAAAAKRQAPEAAPVIEVATAPPAAKVEKPPCPHAATIRTFFAVAREKGFDVSKEGRDRSRGALSQLLGRRIETRADMSAADWTWATNALRRGNLTAW